MRFSFYTHSLQSDWNHGNAHFLRGVMRALNRSGHSTVAYEPEDGWSRRNLLKDQGPAALQRFHDQFPDLDSRIYPEDFDHRRVFQESDVVIVHEWTEPSLIAHLGMLRRSHPVILLFHDTHHRAFSAEPELARLDLEQYDGILAFGESLRERYLRQGWGRQVFTWHEAADDSLFKPIADASKTGDLVWVGNWGDGEREFELEEYLLARSGDGEPFDIRAAATLEPQATQRIDARSRNREPEQGVG